VGEQNAMNLTDPRRQQMCAGVQEMLDLAEQPGAALGRAADHQRVGAGAVENELCRFR
jgi:hypothetical protein